MEMGASSPVTVLALRKRRGTGYTEQLQQYSSPGGDQEKKWVGLGNTRVGHMAGKAGSPQDWGSSLAQSYGGKWACLGCVASPALHNPLRTYSTLLQDLG